MSINNMVMSCFRRLGVENGVVTTSRNEEALLRFSNDRMTVADLVEMTTVSIFIRENGRKAATTIAAGDPDKAVEATETLVSGLRRHAGGEDTPLPQGPFRYRDSKAVPAPMDFDSMAEIVAQAVDSARESGASRSAGSMRVANDHVSLSTTAGAEAETVLPQVELSMRSFSDEGSSGHGLSVGAAMEDIDPAAVGREAGGYAYRSRSTVPIEPGIYDAVLAPMVLADIVSQVGSMASAFYVDMGMSFLQGRVGEQVAAPLLSLTDDPTKDGTIGQRLFDDEGVPVRSNHILKDGVLDGYLHNSTTALAHGVSTTANAGLISPHPFNLIIGKGKGDMEALATEMGDGLVVTNVWYLRYQNHATGEFSVIPRDAVFKVEDGSVQGAVGGLRISDSIPSLLRNIESLGDDRRWVRWWEVDTPTLSPSALVRGVRFTRSTL